MTLDELRKINAEICERAIPPALYRGSEWYLFEPAGRGVIDTRELTPDELDALMERAFETEKWIGRQGLPKPILVGPEILKWADAQPDEKGEDDNETETQQAKAR